jgi:hypothetical protein
MIDGTNGRPDFSTIRRIEMNDNRMLEDAELDAVSGGLDVPLMPVIISTINSVFGTHFPVPPSQVKRGRR